MYTVGYKTEITCNYCKQKTLRPNRAINYARKRNRPLYCDLTCASRANRNIAKMHAGRDRYNITKVKSVPPAPREIERQKAADLTKRKSQPVINNDFTILPAGLCG